MSKFAQPFFIWYMKKINGTITSISVQKKTQSRCSIFVDNEFYLGCSIDIIAKYNIKKGMILSEEIAYILIKENRNHEVKRKALSYATYKPRTIGQVYKAMKDKDFSEDEIKYAVDFLTEFDYVDDRKYARTFVREFSERKKMGVSRLRIELTKRFISREIIDSVLHEFKNLSDTKQLCFEAMEKKLRSLQSKTPEKRKSALIAYLQRQGFTWQEIKECINTTVEQLV